MRVTHSQHCIAFVALRLSVSRRPPPATNLLPASLTNYFNMKETVTDAHICASAAFRSRLKINYSPIKRRHVKVKVWAAWKEFSLLVIFGLHRQQSDVKPSADVLLEFSEDF